MAPIEEKMVESHLRWFGHVRRRLLVTLVRRVDLIEGSPMIRGRGRLRKTLGETIKNDLDLNGESEDMVFDKNTVVVFDPYS